jgi:hypothetical protein
MPTPRKHHGDRAASARERVAAMRARRRVEAGSVTSNLSEAIITRILMEPSVTAAEMHRQIRALQPGESTTFTGQRNFTAATKFVNRHMWGYTYHMQGGITTVTRKPSPFIEEEED